jgi:putative transposase
MKLKAARIRIYPTEAQEQAFRQIAGCCRLLHNLALYQRENFWRQHHRVTGKNIHWMGQKKELPALKQEFPFFSEAPAHCLQMVLQDLQTAYDRFFRGQNGYPKPWRRSDGDSFRFPDPAQIQVLEKDGLFRLPKFGRTSKDHGPIKARFHRKLYGEVRSVTIIREGTHWYASVLLRTKRLAKQKPISQIDPDKVEAYDRNTIRPFVNSLNEEFGEVIARGKTKKAKRRQQKQKRLQQAIARKKKGSKNRAKAVAKLSAFKAQEARQRRDLLNKVTTTIAKNHDVVVLEALKIRNMTASARGTLESPGSRVSQKAGLNGSILDRGWGMFERMLTYKMKWKGGQVLKVPAPHTSQTCPCCGHVSADNRPTQALFLCTSCGFTAPADQSAAMVIRSRGLALLGLVDTRPPAGTVGAACGDLCSSMSLNQEEQNESVNASDPVHV